MEVLHNVMPLAGPSDPPSSFVAVALALQASSLRSLPSLPIHSAAEGRVGFATHTSATVTSCVGCCMQMCEKVRMYGFEPFDPAPEAAAAAGAADGDKEEEEQGEGRVAEGGDEGEEQGEGDPPPPAPVAATRSRGPYYVSEGIDGVYEAGQDDAADEESRSVDAAIIELLRLQKFVDVYN